MSDHMEVIQEPKAREAIQESETMEVIQDRDDMAQIKEGSFVYATTQPSPQSQRSSLAPLSTSIEYPRWTKRFKLINKSEDYSKHPDTFVAKSRTKPAHILLTSVNSTAGSDECLAQTQKQWDTIIKKAKADDKVSEVMKAAKFFHFGIVVRDPKPAHPSEAYVLIRRASEFEAVQEMDGLPLPLKVYAESRRKEIRLRLRTGSVSHEPENFRILPTRSSSIEMIHDKPTTSPDVFSRILDGSDLQIPHIQRISARKFKSGHDLSYLKFAAEEHLNDSELVKGIGRVPINRKTPEPTEPIEDKAWELPADAWALRDLRFLLQKMISSDLNINNHMILPSPTTLLTLEDAEALLLEWNGKSEHKICVVKGRRIKCIHFKDVIMIKYNRMESKLLFQFLSENSSKPEELLLFLSPISDTDWQCLQTCCYSLVKGKPSTQQCDKEGHEFFENKAKALTNLRVKWPPKDSIPNRPVLQSTIKDIEVIPNSQRPLANISEILHSKHPNFEAPHAEPIQSPLSDQEPCSRTIGNSEAQPDTLEQSSLCSTIADDCERAPDIDRDDLGSDQDSTNTEIGFEPDNSAIIPKYSNKNAEIRVSSNVALKAGNASPTGLYYKSILKSGTPLQVRLDDVVVRLRSEKERERGGKRDKLDIFDGPWRIVEFDRPEKTYSMSISIDRDGEGIGSLSLSQYDEREVKKMLKTKVMLSFPRESQAIRWVELSELVPVSKLEDVCNGKLHASCWGVTELAAFKALKNEMPSRNLDTFDPRVEKPREKATDSEGSTDDGIDGNAMNEDDAENVDEDEEELPMHIVEIKRGIFVAVMEANPKAVDDGDSYLVEKLRSKRLRLFRLNSPIVKKSKLKTDEKDPWVKLLLKEMPQLAVNRVVVSEYRVHWAGWADEDDTWDIGTGNIAQGFIDEFHALTDVLRDVSADTQILNAKDMVFKDDLPKQSRGRSLGGGRIKKTPSLKSTARVNNKVTQVTQDNADEEMVIADGDAVIAKAIQASVDDAATMKTKEHLKNLQKEMGVAFKEPDTSVTHDTAMGTEDDNFMECDDQNEDEENDCPMGEVGDIEIANSHPDSGDNDG